MTGIKTTNNYKKFSGMSVSYNVILMKLYESKRVDFIKSLRNKYKTSGMREEDFEDIYQETFIAVYDNISQGRVKKDSCWDSYITAIGMRMASKRFRKIKTLQSYYINDEEAEGKYSVSIEVEERMRTVPEEAPEGLEDPATQNIILRELESMPINQRQLIILHYMDGKKDEEIADMLPQYRSGKSVKVVRNRCMKNLKDKVRARIAV